MMRLPKFRYFAPTSVKEALRVKAGEGPDSAFVAGGTDLYPNMKRRQQTPKVVIGLSRIAALRQLKVGEAGAAIGAGVPLSEVETHRRMRRAFPALVARHRGDLDSAAAQHGDARRQRASRHALQLLRPELRVAAGDRLLHEEGRRDLLGRARLAEVPRGAVGRLRAHPDRPRAPAPRWRLRTASARSRSRTSIANDGIHYLTKRPDELLTEIRVPKRTAGDRPTGSCAAAARSTSRSSRSGRRCASTATGWLEARIVLGAVASAPVRAAGAEALLVGRRLDVTAITEAAAAAAGPSRPMDNTDYSFLWRKEMTGKWVAAALREVAGGPPPA